MYELMSGGIFRSGPAGGCRTRPDGAYRQSGKFIPTEIGPRRNALPRFAAKMSTMNTHENLPMSRIAQLMEQAAARMLRPQLGDGETSLALSLNLTHAVTGPISGNLRTVATYQGGNGREHRFLVHVFDESGLVASAEHSRAIVGARRIVGRHAGKPSMHLHV
jgi:predicted thioesterase